jgi:uncharacterized protein
MTLVSVTLARRGAASTFPSGASLQDGIRYTGASQTALMKAVKHNDVAGVRQLIAQGTNVNESDSSEDVPLIMAAYLGHTEVVGLLLADITAADPSMKATALHAAAYAGWTEAAKLLIQYKTDIDKQGPFNGYTALHRAVWQNNIDTAKVLIEAGANLTLKSLSHETPLDFAKAKKRKEITALIEQRTHAGKR